MVHHAAPSSATLSIAGRAIVVFGKQLKSLEDFPGSTIITVAHRLNTIIDYDHIIALSCGQARKPSADQTRWLRPLLRPALSGVGGFGLWDLQPSLWDLQALQRNPGELCRAPGPKATTPPQQPFGEVVEFAPPAELMRLKDPRGELWEPDPAAGLRGFGPLAAGVGRREMPRQLNAAASVGSENIPLRCAERIIVFFEIN